MPNKEMSTFVVEVDGVVSDTYDIIDSRISSSDITNWTNKGQVYRGNVSINKSTNVATFTSTSSIGITYGNGAAKGKNVISLFYDNENNDIYTLSGHEYVSDSGSQLTYICIVGNTLKKIVTQTLTSGSNFTTFNGTYSESTLVSSVDGKFGTVTILPSGGLTGQVLKKTSGTNYAVEWANESGGGNNPTIDTEWEDVYGEWQAGYYYDPDNDYAYTQIPSTETTWGETETYISVSCTPYTNLIPVKSGEEWRYLNLPIYFDSKQAIVPSIILFDSSKNVVETYTRSYEDVYTQFIIPSDATQMAVLYASNQEYVLQKRVAKTLDKDALLVDIMADYRSYSLITPPTPKTLTKGYICLGTDDLRSWETKNLHNVFTTNNIPYYMAAIPGALKNCIPDDPYKTNLDYMRLCVTNGGEIICHSAPVITANNKNDFDTMYTYFCKNKQELEAYGFKVRGIFKAGGENAIYDAPDPIIDAWATHYYEFGDYFTESFPFYNPRTILEDWEDYSGFLDNLVEEICVNHGYFIGAFHLYNSSTQLVITTLLNKLSNYTRGVDYDFVTPSQLYDLLMPSGPSSGGGSSITYGLSISNNVITLSGSNGSTSAVTLPIYGGGVS